LIGRSSGVSTGITQGQATAQIQQSTTVAQAAITQIVVTQVAITQVAVTQIIATSPPAPTPAPVVVVATPTIPPPTPKPENTPPGSVLNPGETWKQDGAELTLVEARFEPDTIFIDWQFKNNTRQSLAVKYDESNFTVQDSLGRKLQTRGFSIGSTICQGSANSVLQPQDTIKNKGCEGVPFNIEIDLSNNQVTDVTITATNISRIARAQWKVPLTVH
jgi:hypothetical protein